MRGRRRLPIAARSDAPPALTPTLSQREREQDRSLPITLAPLGRGRGEGQRRFVIAARPDAPPALTPTRSQREMEREQKPSQPIALAPTRSQRERGKDRGRPWS